jgi:hypothetical protein
MLREKLQSGEKLMLREKLPLGETLLMWLHFTTVLLYCLAATQD